MKSKYHLDETTELSSCKYNWLNSLMNKWTDQGKISADIDSVAKFIWLRL